ncbi:MAG: hypothetical protein A3K67_06195 [Euryarchaeota archaeon RBG_16_62_10]|nr:MAG: hypothetical protein A3K67_06195 [Euryarchaeota archaeon RBG_16_62_10]
MIALMASPGVSADTRTLSPGVPFSVDANADFGDQVNYTWSTAPAGSIVRFVITDPDGDVIYNQTMTGADSELFFLQEGEYTFTWTNLEPSSITLNYDVEVWDIGIPNVGDAFDAALFVAIIGVVVVAVVIAIVIYLVFVGGKKKQAQQPVYGSQGPGPVYQAPQTPGVCPTCGSPVEPQASFCSRCGARFR